jgi:hypothetical protein
VSFRIEYSNHLVTVSLRGRFAENYPGKQAPSPLRLLCVLSVRAESPLQVESTALAILTLSMHREFDRCDRIGSHCPLISSAQCG